MVVGLLGGFTTCSACGFEASVLLRAGFGPVAKLFERPD